MLRGMNEKMSYEFEQGRYAYHHGVSLEENPYLPGTDYDSWEDWHKEWKRGWEYAALLNKGIINN